MAELPFDPSKLSREELDIYKEMVARRQAQGAAFGGPYAALMNHPELCKRIEELGFYLKFNGHLPRDLYQFVVLRVARRTGATFEWIDHVKHAEAAGVPDSVIGLLAQEGMRGGDFPEPYSLVAKILDCTLAFEDVPRALQDECIAKVGVKGFVEIVVLSGFYQMFSAINQGFAVPLPPGCSVP